MNHLHSFLHHVLPFQLLFLNYLLVFPSLFTYHYLNLAHFQLLMQPFQFLNQTYDLFYWFYLEVPQNLHLYFHPHLFLSTFGHQHELHLNSAPSLFPLYPMPYNQLFLFLHVFILISAIKIPTDLVPQLHYLHFLLLFLPPLTLTFQLPYSQTFEIYQILVTMAL